MGDIESNQDKAYTDLLFNIREVIHILGLQQEVMLIAVDKCKKLNPDSFKACTDAVNDVHKEILRFLELDVRLAKYIDELKKCLSDKELKSIGAKK